MSRYGRLPLNSLGARWLPLLLLAMSHGALGGDLAATDSRLQIHGFLTQAYVKTTDNRIFGDSEDGSFEFRELGVNASYRFNPSLMASAQLLSRVAGDMYDGSLAVDYAQLDYLFYMNERERLGGQIADAREKEDDEEVARLQAAYRKIQERIEKQTEYTCWSPTHDNGFHDPSRFGVVEFVERP